MKLVVVSIFEPNINEGHSSSVDDGKKSWRVSQFCKSHSPKNMEPRYNESN